MMSWIWLAVIILAIVIEAAGPQLICIWFAFGGLGAMIASLLKAPLWLQLAIFIVASVIALLITRPVAKKLTARKTEATNADRFLGMEALVTDEINEVLGSGRVTVKGMSWSAVSENGETIKKGEKVTVLSIEGVKLKVRPLA